jgi:hypothetical protein
MDNLSRDAIAAEKAGMSYGQWKAFHPHTDPDKMPVVRRPKRVVNGSTATCPVCGRQFEVTKDRSKYCSVECRDRRKARV